jgi:hypothetical protein
MLKFYEIEQQDWIYDVGDFLENENLSHEKMHIFNIICFKTNGLYFILGT